MPGFLLYPYFGPSRRSNKKVVELHVDFSVDTSVDGLVPAEDARQRLVGLGVLAADDLFPEQPPGDEAMVRLSSLLAQTALLLQRKNGHRVAYFTVWCSAERRRCTVLIEHEHSEVGMAAAKLAIAVFSAGSGVTPNAYRAFSEFAAQRALPLETEAILGVLRQRDVPYLQLEHEPLAGNIDTGVRIRRNGLICVGHGVNSQVLDGTFCVSRAGDVARSLLQNPAQRRALITQLGLFPSRLEAGAGEQLKLVHILVINSKATVVGQRENGAIAVLENVHESLFNAALQISAQVGFVPVSVAVQSNDVRQPLGPSGGGVVDFNLAPDLYALLGQCQGQAGLLESVAGDLVDWLVPDPAKARIPIVAVTGTNGKTTTSRMLDHVFRAAGFKPGLVCTDGIFLDGREVSSGDGSAFIGHARVLASNSVDAAVLETHHRGLAVRGFAFDRCHVAICLNVTREHLAESQIETVEEMAELKRSLLERASRGAVLNADNALCLGMLPHLDAKRICLFSSTRSAQDLAEFGGGNALFCLVQPRGGEDWVVLHDQDSRHELLPVASMPCTFGGAARFNLENAMAAIAGCYLAGIDPKVIGTAMQSFAMSHERTPGRLNHYRDLPFDAVVDFAHNPDGIARLAEFVLKMPIQGKRLLLISVPGSSSDETVADMARAVAGKFDRYVCRSYPNTRGREPEEVPKILRAELLAAGVPEASITVEPDGHSAVEQILSMAAPTDLVILQLSRPEFDSSHARLVGMASANTAA